MKPKINPAFCMNYRLNDLIAIIQKYSDELNNPNIISENIDIKLWSMEKEEVFGFIMKNKPIR